MEIPALHLHLLDDAAIVAPSIAKVEQAVDCCAYTDDQTDREGDPGDDGISLSYGVPMLTSAGTITAPTTVMSLSV